MKQELPLIWGLNNCKERSSCRDKEKVKGISLGGGREIKNSLLAMLKLKYLLGIILGFSGKFNLGDGNLDVIAILQVAFKARGTG